MPIAVMFCLVVLLGITGSSARHRIVAAHHEVEARQKVRVALIDVRSLSRSVQRDALNLILESEPAERTTIRRKVTSRLDEMNTELKALARDATFETRDRTIFVSEQREVMELLRQSVQLAERDQRPAALARFRLAVRPAERRASALADRLVAEQAHAVEAQLALAHDIERRETILWFAVSVLLFLIAAGVTLLLVRRLVAQPLRDIERAMTRLANGEAEGATPHMDRMDDVGRMARAIEVFRAAARRQDEMRAEQAGQLERMLAVERRQRVLDEKQAARSHRLGSAAQALEQETGALLVDSGGAASSLYDAARTLAELSASTRTELDQVRAATSRVTAGAADIATATDQFMTDLERSRAATNGAAAAGRAAARQVDALLERMRRVAEDAERVATAIDLVGNLARQTDLLALNASIEAARAGPAGRGFAVVANEVKALAVEAARTTAEIGERVDGMRAATGEAGESLRLVGATVARLAEQSATLADDIGAQSDQGAIISHNIAGTAADLDLIAIRVLDSVAAAEKVDDLSTRLRRDASGIAARTDRLGGALERFFADLHAAEADSPLVTA